MDELRERVETLRTNEIDKQKEAFELANPDGEWADPDPKSISVRLDDRWLYKLLQDELNKNAPRNRGYVLDGFPRRYEDAQHIFLHKKQVWNEDAGEWETPEDEEQEEPYDFTNPNSKKIFNQHYVIDDKIKPDSCILLTGSDADLIKRVKHLPEA